MHTADIADQLAAAARTVQKYPHVIIAVKEVFQRSHIILHQIEADGIVHAEVMIVVFFVIGFGHDQRLRQFVLVTKVRYCHSVKCIQIAELQIMSARPCTVNVI